MSLQEILVEGPLKKQKSGALGGWNTRWFRLRTDGLFYYQSVKAPSDNEQPSGTIEIARGKYFRVSRNIQNAIEIVVGVGGSQERMYVLAAASMEDRNKWLKGLSDWQKLQRPLSSVSSSFLSSMNPAATARMLRPVSVNDEAEPPSERKEAGPSLDMTLFQPKLNQVQSLLEELAQDIGARGNASHRQFVRASILTSINALFANAPDRDEMAAPPSTRHSDLVAFVDPAHRNLLQRLLSEDTEYKYAVELSNSLGAESDSVVRAFINVFELANSSIPFLAASIAHEVACTEQEGTLFRSNSISTKMLTCFMRLNGQRYLLRMLRPLVMEAAQSNQPVEVHPPKLSPGADLNTNQANLVALTEQFLEQIFNSIPYAPGGIREVARQLQVIVTKKFPAARNSSVGGLVFLRFICPALLMPDAAGLITDSSAEVRRKLLLVAKILQNLANGVLFGSKEDYMIPLNPLVERNMERFQTFCTAFVTPDRPGGFVPEFRVVTKAEVDCAEEDLRLLQREALRFRNQSIVSNPSIPLVEAVTSPTRSLHISST